MQDQAPMVGLTVIARLVPQAASLGLDLAEPTGWTVGIPLCLGRRVGGSPVRGGRARDR